MQRRITIGNLTYICNLSYRDNVEYWSCANAEKVSEFLRKNGAEIIAIHEGSLPQRIEVDRNVYHFEGKTYRLHQIENNLFEWFSGSKEGEFTYYYDNIIFNTGKGFVGAHRDNITNFTRI